MPDITNKEQVSKGALQAGVKAPDFSLPTTPDQSVSLHEFRGRPVILIFYPADWSPVCGDELTLFNQVLPEFKKYQAEPLGISVDSAWSHQAYSKENNIHFPLMSDFEPKGAVARKYHVYDEKNGRAERALFVIDPEGVIFWSYVSPSGINPGADGVLSALDEMKERQEAQHGKAQ